MSSVTFTAEAETAHTPRRKSHSLSSASLGLPLRRVLAIDCFRGLTILVMIFVNTLQSVKGMPSWLYHTPDDAEGLTLPDLVFPAFLFIVGMAIPFATSQRLAAGDTVWGLARHVLTRTLGLLVLGVFMVNAEEGYDEDEMALSIGSWSLLFYAFALMVWGICRFRNKTLTIALRIIGVAGLVGLAVLFRGGDEGDDGLSPQWWGILGLIGWSYLFSSTIFGLTKGRLLPLSMALALTVIYACLGQIAQSQSSGLLQLLTAQSENAVHTAIALSGVLTALLLFNARADTQRQNLRWALLLAIVLFAAGAILQPYWGVSKSDATPSWALYSASLCILVFCFLYWLIDLRCADGWTGFLRPAAANPLLIYILPNIVAAAMKTLHLEMPVPLTVGMGGLVFAITYAFAMLALAHRIPIKLKL